LPEFCSYRYHWKIPHLLLDLSITYTTASITNYNYVTNMMASKTNLPVNTTATPTVTLQRHEGWTNKDWEWLTSVLNVSNSEDHRSLAISLLVPGLDALVQKRSKNPSSPQQSNKGVLSSEHVSETSCGKKRRRHEDEDESESDQESVVVAKKTRTEREEAVEKILAGEIRAQRELVSISTSSNRSFGSFADGATSRLPSAARCEWPNANFRVSRKSSLPQRSLGSRTTRKEWVIRRNP
jgi:hypothetical protein